MNQRNTIDRTDKPLPNLSLGTPLERLKRISKELALAIEIGDRTPIHNNIEFMRLALKDYDTFRHGEADLPF
jgi:hypothetical protein